MDLLLGFGRRTIPVELLSLDYRLLGFERHGLLEMLGDRSPTKMDLFPEHQAFFDHENLLDHRDDEDAVFVADIRHLIDFAIDWHSLDFYIVAFEFFSDNEIRFVHDSTNPNSSSFYLFLASRYPLFDKRNNLLAPAIIHISLILFFHGGAGGDGMLNIRQRSQFLRLRNDLA